MSASAPDPPRSGGQLRTLRLLEQMDGAGLHPHLLIGSAVASEHLDAVRKRGWSAEAFEPPPRRLGDGVRVHLRGLMQPPNPRLSRRAQVLLERNAALLQVEQTQSAQDLVPTPLPTIFSTHNVDGELYRTVADEATSRAARIRALAIARNAGRAERRTARAAHTTLCVSAHDAEAFDRAGATRTVVAPNGVDDSLFAVPDPGDAEPVVLFFGMLSWDPNRHGITRFLREGWNVTLERVPGARLRIVGRGANSALATLAAATPGATLVGEVDSIAAELARARVVIAPLWSGGGTRIKVIEALAAGRPVVGTPLGVERLGFEDGQHGIIAAEPAEIAKGAAELLLDPERCARLAGAGRSHADAYRWDEVLRPARDLYLSCLDQVGAVS